MSKKEKMMSILLAVLILLFLFVVILVVSNKKYGEDPVQDLPKLTVNDYVKVEKIDTEKYKVVYKEANLNRIKFNNLTDVLFTKFYEKQDKMLKELEDNINSNKEFIDSYNKDNDVKDYTANSKIESIVLYEIKDDILSVMNVIDDNVDYKETNSYINNILIDIKNNSLLTNSNICERYNLSKNKIENLVLNNLFTKLEDYKKINEEEFNIDDYKSKTEDYLKVIDSKFDEELYIYIYQGNIYLKYSFSNLANLLFETEVANKSYSTVKLEIKDLTN